MATGLQLGRPGVYAVPRRDDGGLQSVRLDVAGFVGVAPRGPVDTPVVVSSWSDYERQFGAFEGTEGAPERLLPYAVQAFFAQGGVRAYAMRVAPPPEFDGPTGDDATARYAFVADGDRRWEFAAADEGVWGNELSIRLDFEVAQTFRTTALDPSRLALPAGANPVSQSLVRIRRRDLDPTGEFRWLVEVAGHDRASTLDRPLPDAPAPADPTFEVEVITGTLVISDSSSAFRREERLSGLGLARGHPRFIATVLHNDSLLVTAVGPWDAPLLPDRFPLPRQTEPSRPGLDRNHGVDGRSFFDDGDASDDVLDELDHHRGADGMGRVAEVGLLCVPDLTWRALEPRPQPAAPARARPASHCDRCAPPDAVPELPEPQAPPLGLDARNGEDLEEIVRRQLRLVQIADLRRRFIALLDVPSKLPVRRITEWRARFDSSFAAAYHPWLGVPRLARDGGGSVATPPSGFAAGIIAAREKRSGLPWGPANEIARGAVLSVEAVTDVVHDELHLLGVNVYRAERDGFRLAAARTLSSDREYRQLSVRRFMTMLALTLERQTQWLVFEPSTAELRGRLVHTVTEFLRDLHRRGSFAGATEEESFFVSCEDGLNPVQSQREGRLLAEIGVAPASPLEYLVLRVSQDVDGMLSIGSDRG